MKKVAKKNVVKKVVKKSLNDKIFDAIQNGFDRSRLFKKPYDKGLAMQIVFDKSNLKLVPTNKNFNAMERKYYKRSEATQKKIDRAAFLQIIDKMMIETFESLKTKKSPKELVSIFTKAFAQSGITIKAKRVTVKG